MSGMREDQFCSAARQFPAQNSKEDIRKKSLSPKIIEGKLKRSQRSVKETKVVKRKTQDKAYSSIWR